AIGAGVGAGAGALIGNRMDKQQKELQQELADQAKVEQTTDQNGLRAIKVTFDGGILFPTNGTTLSESAKADLAKFAASVNENPGTNVQIYGFTDNTGTLQVNQKVADGRANAVLRDLVNDGVSPVRLTAEGIPMADYVASNDTPQGRAQNRRVEIYVTAGPEMIQQAEAGILADSGTLK
ncbi:MAG: OmpA family protein, partial [Clostridium sp.]|nr:OmpA family protein [Clostridium sp.]